MPELISPAEYARRRGVSRAAVTYAVKSGRIRLIEGKLDPEVADIQWDKNTRKVMGQGGTSSTAASVPRMPSLPRDDEGLPISGYDYETARAKREYHEANIAEMKERERAGELVETARIAKALTDIGAIFRASLERLPDRIAAQVAAETDPDAVHAILEKELIGVLDDIRQAVTSLPEAIATADDLKQ